MVPTPEFVEPMNDPLNDRYARLNECGPFVTLEMLQPLNSGSLKYGSITLTLTDIGPYLAAYRDVEKTRPVRSSTTKF